MLKTDFDIIIIGAGPTGLVLANLLGKYHKNILIIDKYAEVLEEPRAIHIDATTIRILEETGVLDEELRASFDPLPKIEYRDKKSTMVEIDPGICKINNAPASSWFYQPLLEKKLRSKLHAHASVNIHFGEAVSSITHNGNYSVTTQQGSEYTSRFLVACDGANSKVREIFSPPVIMHNFEEEWIVADIKIQDPGIFLQLPDSHIQFCSAKQPLTYIRYKTTHLRLETKINAGQQGLDILKERIHEYLGLKLDDAKQLEILRHRNYKFKTAFLADTEQLRAFKSLFFAGDAAHVMPPFIGQGMCTGIRDAYNLQWRLRMCLDLKNTDILNDYYTERIQEWKFNTKMSMLIGKFIGLENLFALKIRKALAGLIQFVVTRTKLNVPFAYSTPGFMKSRKRLFYKFNILHNKQTIDFDRISEGQFCIVLKADKLQKMASEKPLPAILERVRVIAIGRPGDKSTSTSNKHIKTETSEIVHWRIFGRNDFYIIRPDKYIHSKGRMRKLATHLSELQREYRLT